MIADWAERKGAHFIGAAATTTTNVVAVVAPLEQFKRVEMLETESCGWKPSWKLKSE